MTEYIDKQAAIDLLKQMRKDGDMVPWEGKDVFARIRKLPSVQPEQRWIPCEERLPEKGQGCLVCDKGKILIDTFLGDGGPYNWRWYVRDYEAWMPLPEPYQEGATDEADRR